LSIKLVRFTSLLVKHICWYVYAYKHDTSTVVLYMCSDMCSIVRCMGVGGREDDQIVFRFIPSCSGFFSSSSTSTFPFIYIYFTGIFKFSRTMVLKLFSPKFKIILTSQINWLKEHHRHRHVYVQFEQSRSCRAPLNSSPALSYS